MVESYNKRCEKSKKRYKEYKNRYMKCERGCKEYKNEYKSNVTINTKNVRDYI